MKYSPDECKRHTLYNGTEIIQTRAFGHAKVLAVVIHTGVYTLYQEFELLIICIVLLSLYCYLFYVLVVVNSIGILFRLCYCQRIPCKINSVSKATWFKDVERYHEICNHPCGIGGSWLCLHHLHFKTSSCESQYICTVFVYGTNISMIISNVYDM